MSLLTATHKITQQEFLKKCDINHSFLTIHNFGSNMLEYLELGMPYMVIYESFSVAENKMCVYEFTESSHNLIATDVTSSNPMPERPLHVHDFYEMTFVLSGEVHMQVEHEHKTYHCGEFCFCNKNIRHIEHINSDCEFVCLMFTEKYLEDILKNDIFYDADGTTFMRSSFVADLLLENKISSVPDAKKYIDFTLARPVTSELNLTPILKLINTIVEESSEKKPGSSFF